MHILLTTGVSVCGILILSTIVQQALGAVTLGTEFLPSPTQASESVWFYTKPANASVQLGDTYYTLLIVKHNSSVWGYCYVELGIGKTSINISSDYNHDQWNINMASIHNPDHGLCIAQLNITFDDTTWKGISTILTDANMTSITIRYIFRFYNKGDPFDFSSSMAFIDLKKNNSSDNDDSEESGSGVDDNGTHTDSSKGGNATTGSAQEHASSHMTTNTVSSSFQLGIVTELLIIFSLIVLSFSVV